MDFCFIILNYIAYEETIKCIAAIHKITKDYTYHIVVVDNGSPNASYKILIEKFIKDNTVTILNIDENQGFAKGNNVGYRWCKSNFNPNFIICLNSDVIIEQKDFLYKIIKKYKKVKFDVLGPDVRRPLPVYTEHQNPHGTKLASKKEILIEINKLKTHLYDLENDMDYRNNYISKQKKERRKNNIKSLIPWLFRIKYKLQNNINENEWKNERKNCILHGSCLIFSKRFIDKYDKAFSEKTFLYGEEKLLYLKLREENGTLIYYPDVYVIHKHGISTEQISDNVIDVEIFRTKNALRSAEILLSLLDNDNID